MSCKFLPVKIYFFFTLLLFQSIGRTQTNIEFSSLVSDAGKPDIIGQSNGYFYCLYSDDSVSQFVIYNADMKEVSRFNYNLFSTGESFEAFQAFIMENKLTVILQQQFGGSLQVKYIELDEKGRHLNEGIIITDTTGTGQSFLQYNIEISKNNKYILLYKGIHINSDSLLFKGYLFDNKWNCIKKFEIPIEKQETEDSWFGAVVDIEGNIHSLVFSKADSWRKGTKLRLHSISRQLDEMRSEQLDIGRKRLINFVLSEDTLSRVIQLQAVAIRQHTNAPLEGLAFISFPFERSGKIRFSSHEFTREEKKRLAKSITSENNLLASSVIDAPLSIGQGGLFLTSILVQADSSRLKPVDKNEEYLNSETFSNKTNLPMRSAYGNSPYNYSPSQYVDRNGSLDHVYRYLKAISGDKKKNRYPARLTILKNTPHGTQVYWAEKLLQKSTQPVYNESFSFGKNNEVKMLAYIMDVDKPTLYLLTTGEQIEETKIATPDNSLLLLSAARLVNENIALVPYIDSKSRKYGIAKIVF